jgi:hypothetical protein
VAEQANDFTRPNFERDIGQRDIAAERDMHIRHAQKSPTHNRFFLGCGWDANGSFH